MKPAERIQAVQPPIIPSVAEWIQQNPGTISLGQGVVHYPPPQAAMARMQTALQAPGVHIYKAVGGIEELVESISKKLQAENQIRVASPQQVVVTAGSNMGFMNAILAITNPGDEVILPSPYYFNHEMAITLAGCQPVLVPTSSEYQLQPEKIRAALTGRTRAIVTVSPNNPTGAVYPQESLQAVNDLCREWGLYHISDEAYEYFTYEDAAHFSPGSLEGANRHTISLFSLSKAYGFASWRIGYMVIPEHLRSSIVKIQDTILICPPVVSQHAAVGALEVGKAHCAPHLKEFASVRRLVLEELQQLGHRIHIPQTQGAFYFFIKINSPEDSLTLARQLIEQFQIAVIPGSAFGVSEGCYLRVAYGALGKDTVAQGMGRLAAGLQALVG